jgi:DNA-directed RNA polymerase subunit beta
VLKVLIDIKNGHGTVDDIDHLGNRRVRSVGEMAENTFRIGLVRVERAVRERLSLAEADGLTPQDLINAKPVAAAVKEFFGSSQLSPVHGSEQSAVGSDAQAPRLRAWARRSDARACRLRSARRASDPLRPRLHHRNAGRPEHRPDQLARRVRPHQLSTASSRRRTARSCQRQGHRQGGLPVGDRRGRSRDRAGELAAHKHGGFVEDFVSCRFRGESELRPASEVDYMDVSPMQTVSVAAALVPFLEHDDANRALMGANMQRQAVPTLRSQTPLVGTGIERAVARDSGVITSAKRGGVIDQVDAAVSWCA